MSCATTKGTWNAIWSNKFTVSTFVRPSNWRTHRAHSEAVSCDCIHAASCGVIGLRRKTRKTSKTTSQLQLTRKRPQAGFQETHQIVRRSKKLRHPPTRSTLQVFMRQTRSLRRNLSRLHENIWQNLSMDGQQASIRQDTDQEWNDTDVFILLIHFYLEKKMTMNVSIESPCAGITILSTKHH